MLGQERRRLEKDGLALLPSGTAHDVRNVGETTARCLGFFGRASVVSRHEDVFQPGSEQVFDSSLL